MSVLETFAKENAMPLSIVRLTFLIAGLYDFVIGVAFLFAGRKIFEEAGVPLPNQWAYLYFGCLLLMIFGVMFLAVAYDPIANRNLMPYGMLLKISYVGMVAFYWFYLDYCATLFKPFAVIDAVMLVLFVLAFIKSAAPGVGSSAGANA
jgi:hypothetical protein